MVLGAAGRRPGARAAMPGGSTLVLCAWKARPGMTAIIWTSLQYAASYRC
ncbi:MAG: hypothetical protein QXU79_00025 [Candidatus Micrarchaeaceae archaeon]